MFFTAQMEADTKDQTELHRDLRLALDDPSGGALSLHYQAKVCTHNGQITGVEALLRWRHPVRGMVGPAQFIPVAERFGVISALGAWVIEQACQQLRQWQAQGLWLAVAVNLSVHQLRQPGLVAHVQATLQHHQLDPQWLHFEITESATMAGAT